jgi:Sodium/hydrogen exchanger family
VRRACCYGCILLPCKACERASKSSIATDFFLNKGIMFRRQSIHCILALFSVFSLLAAAPTVHGNQHELEPVDAVLYPWFIQVLGVAVFLILTRYARWLPYTAIMFLMGTIIGIGTARMQKGNRLSESILEFWIPINSELLLNVFLPGLIYKDSAALNVHLLQVSLWQCIIFAFPMVLAGTTLTALVAYYIFPYGWSFPLAMTFGSILSATVSLCACVSYFSPPWVF